MSDLTIRKASPEDADALLSLYAPYVTHTAVTFEYEVPTKEEFTQRIETTLRRYPYLVAVSDEKIVGYCYAGPLKGRAAYDWSCEMSLYVGKSEQHKGIGKRLYTEIEKILCEMGIVNLFACIVSPKEEDEYLTDNSAVFHAHMGYRRVGLFEHAGYKFGRWYHVLWMEKNIGEHSAGKKPLVPYPVLCQNKTLER